ncbi:MAG: hypothetical protein JWM10_3689 [Myxococcaceae bacterium]|nr:hypothetical protein [Myxococcaceae bacterium]
MSRFPYAPFPLTTSTSAAIVAASVKRRGQCRSGVCALAFVVLAACEKPGVTAGAPAGGRGRPQAELARVTPSEVELLNGHVEGVEGGIVHVISGGVRVDARGPVLRFAEEVIPSRIEHAVRASRGWVFVTERGEVYASDTFTGRLRALRNFDCSSGPRGAVEVSVSEGRVTLTVGGAHPHWTDGVALEALNAEVLSVAWTSDEVGLALVENATLRLTGDGGRSWRDVASDGRPVPVGVAGVEGELYALTSDGWRRLRDGALVTTAAPRLPSWTPLAPPDEVHEAMRRALGRRFDRAPVLPAVCLPPAPPAEPFADVVAPFAAQVPTRRSSDGALAWSLPRGAPAPLGTVGQRARAEAGGIPALVAITAQYRGEAGRITLDASWRGEDDRGSFSRYATASMPENADNNFRWDAIAAPARASCSSRARRRRAPRRPKITSRRSTSSSGSAPRTPARRTSARPCATSRAPVGSRSTTEARSCWCARAAHGSRTPG